MRTLDDVGFYTMTEKRVATSTCYTPVYRAEFIITDLCNFKCPYCRGIDCGGYLKYRDFAEQLGYVGVGTRGLKNIRFSGGEPTLHSDLGRFVELAKKHHCEHIAISTNGSADREVYNALLEAGVNDFSISLDACCSSFGEKMCGGIPGAWEKVIDNIKYLSKKTYVTLGMVFDDSTIETMPETVQFGHDLGVADIRVISSAQSDLTLSGLKSIDWNLLKDHPILKYRVMNTVEGRHVRGLTKMDSDKCPLVMDDVMICNGHHYACPIHMREHGEPIGKVGPGMWNEREIWWLKHNTQKDPICKHNCIECCVDFNNRWELY